MSKPYIVNLTPRIEDATLDGNGTITSVVRFNLSVLGDLLQRAQDKGAETMDLIVEVDAKSMRTI